MAQTLKILFFADSHLGFDLPLRPRIERRRRGFDFFANFEAILKAAVAEKVDLIVHGGDLFFRAVLPNALVTKVALPMAEVAESGIPIFIVPGNHERSRIPNHFGFTHRHIHIFHQAQTFLFEKDGFNLALAGFPFIRRIGQNFREILLKTAYRKYAADARLLCLHQAFSGAQVGVMNYTFRGGPEVVTAPQLPADFLAILSGHIHRSQILDSDVEGHSFPCPVIYPGAIERTSFVEREEEKGYFILHLDCTGRTITSEFRKLPDRPMFKIALRSNGENRNVYLEKIASELCNLPNEAVVQLVLPQQFLGDISTAAVRTVAPAEMNVSISVPR